MEAGEMLCICCCEHALEYLVGHSRKNCTRHPFFEDRQWGGEGAGKDAYPSSAVEHEPGVLDLSGPLHPFVGGL